MTKTSAGILLYKRDHSGLSILLLHLGGPYWSKKDSWTIPKGELEPLEQEIDAAKREFREEVGQAAPPGQLLDLGSIRQSAVKTNHIWALEGDFDIANFCCNEFEMEWPPHSGHLQLFPECDKAEWFDPLRARQKLLSAQVAFIDNLEQALLLKNC